MDEATCWALVAAAGHGALATHHPSGRIDVVPVVLAVDGATVLLPVDTVKAKRTTDLQRLADLSHDARCTLLVDHHDDDWSQLWWVRLQGVAVLVAESEREAAVATLARRHPPYRAAGAVAEVVALTVERVTGWSQIERSGDGGGVGA